ncbi:unnamed protein product [Chironomus riparius]|uniref:Uncharacterized protein n=1 Tax=Chironomus riparius TaxID=315576 RepID=A0A9N9S150_9DIPT|nr:unnamed protein product [Chironomus riparius]
MKIVTLTCVIFFVSFVNGCLSSSSKSSDKPVCNNCNVGPPSNNNNSDGPICNNCNVGPPSSSNSNKGGPICNNCEIGPPSGPDDPYKRVKKPEYGPDCECVGTTCYHCNVGK